MVPPVTARAVWLLDVDLGGGVQYLATEAVVGYLPGLTSPGAVERGTEGETLTIHDPDYTARRYAYGSPRGRRATLRLRYPDGTTETVLRGAVARVEWGDSAAPGVVRVTIDRTPPAPSSTILPPGAVLDREGWGDLPDSSVGEIAPLVIGRPGHTSTKAYGLTASYPGAPALVVDVGLTTTYAVACHAVAATEVRVYDLDDATSTPADYPVTTTLDGLGREVSTVEISAGVFAADPQRVAIAWGRDGGGVVADGAELRGLGGVLVWGAATYGTGADLAAARSYAAELDRYLVDVVINDPDLSWSEWVESIAEVYGLRLDVSADGWVWAPEVYAPRPAAVRARLTTTGDGWRVTRVGGYEETDEPVPSVLVVRYAQHEGGQWARRVEYGPADDGPRRRRHPVCVAGAELGGEVTTYYAPTSDAATAWALAARLLERLAPAQVATYSGDLDLGRTVRAGDTVEVDGVAGVVVRVVLGDRTEVTVRTPDRTG